MRALVGAARRARAMQADFIIKKRVAEFTNL